MAVYAVVLDSENDVIAEKIRKHYPNAFEYTATFFLVADKSVTSQVAKTIGIDGSDQPSLEQCSD